MMTVVVWLCARARVCVWGGADFRILDFLWTSRPKFEQSFHIWSKMAKEWAKNEMRECFQKTYLKLLFLCFLSGLDNVQEKPPPPLSGQSPLTHTKPVFGRSLTRFAR